MVLCACTLSLAANTQTRRQSESERVKAGKQWNKYPRFVDSEDTRAHTHTRFSQFSTRAAVHPTLWPGPAAARSMPSILLSILHQPASLERTLRPAQKSHRQNKTESANRSGYLKWMNWFGSVRSASDRITHDEHIWSNGTCARRKGMLRNDFAGLKSERLKLHLPYRRAKRRAASTECRSHVIRRCARSAEQRKYPTRSQRTTDYTVDYWNCARNLPRKKRQNSQPTTGETKSAEIYNYKRERTHSNREREKKGSKGASHQYCITEFLAAHYICSIFVQISCWIVVVQFEIFCFCLSVVTSGQE